MLTEFRYSGAYIRIVLASVRKAKLFAVQLEGTLIHSVSVAFSSSSVSTKRIQTGILDESVKPLSAGNAGSNFNLKGQEVTNGSKQDATLSGNSNDLK